MQKLLLTLLLIFLPVNAYALNTQWLNPTPQGHDLNNVIYGANKYMAVGSNGALISSVDGYSWTKQTSGSIEHMYDIVWSGSQFVAVGGGVSWYNHPEIITSPDGVNWTKQNVNLSAGLLRSVIWDGNQFVIVGSGGVLTSSDGISWVSRATGDLYDVVWNGSVFVTVGFFGMIKTSVDGLTWSQQAFGTFGTLYNLTWTGTQFIALGNTGTIVTSPDGVTWTSQNIPTANPLNQLIWTGTMFVATSNAGTVYTSLDALTWTQQTTTDTGWTSGIVWSGTQYVAVGETGVILTSPDAINWTNQSVVARTNINAIASSGTIYVAVGNTGEILRSADGIIWSVQTSGVTQNLWDVMWDGTKFIAVGNATIITSPDGITWTARAVAVNQVLNTISWSGTKYIAAGINASLVESLDGITWTTLTGNGHTYASAWGNGVFVTTGISGGIFTSPDAITWTGTPNPGGNITLNDIAWSGAMFVAVGDGGSIATSTNGTTWSAQNSGTTLLLKSVSWDGAQFIVTAGTQLLTSVDGVNWTMLSTDSVRSLTNSMTVGAKTFVVGQLGSIFQVDFSPNLQEVTPVSPITNNTTPTYAFSSDEAGTITYGGGCSSATTSAVVGNNTITLNTLTDGVYSICTIAVTNSLGKTSAPLTLSTFTIDTIAPNAPSITQPSNNIVTNNTAQPVISGSSDNNVTINIMDGNTNIATVAGGLTWTLNAGVATFTAGLHPISATAVDVAGNTSLSSPIVNYTVDVTPPTITVPSNITVEATSASGVNSNQSSIVTFLAAASATDNIAGTPIISHNAPTLFALGDTSVTFTATDTASNTGSLSATVSVVDTTPPTITLNGSVDVYVEAGSTYTEAGASATDIVDGNVSVQATGSVNTNIVGLYNLTYSASDAHTNTAAPVVRHVHVIDTTLPVFLNLPIADVYTSSTNVTLTPPNVLDVSPVTVTSDAPSSYQAGATTVVTWTATDSSGNSVTATQNIIVSAATVTPPANTGTNNNTSGGGGGCIAGSSGVNTLLLFMLLLVATQSRRFRFNMSTK